MRVFGNTVWFVLLAFSYSCSSIATFPVSSAVPAAKITAKKTLDDNKNSLIELKAENLASADRLDPPMNNYSVWILTENNGVKNIGQLNNTNAKKTILKTLTTFEVDEIFITAEEQGNLSYPQGLEISRTKFKKSQFKK
jgi:hypothetical protein